MAPFGPSGLCQPTRAALYCWVLVRSTRCPTSLAGPSPKRTRLISYELFLVSGYFHALFLYIPKARSKTLTPVPALPSAQGGGETESPAAERSASFTSPVINVFPGRGFWRKAPNRSVFCTGLPKSRTRFYDGTPARQLHPRRHASRPTLFLQNCKGECQGGTSIILWSHIPDVAVQYHIPHTYLKLILAII